MHVDKFVFFLGESEFSSMGKNLARTFFPSIFDVSVTILSLLVLWNRVLVLVALDQYSQVWLGFNHGIQLGSTYMEPSEYSELRVVCSPRAPIEIIPVVKMSHVH